jgi:hypothetical protein
MLTIPEIATVKQMTISDTYRQALADVAARAREVLPAVCHSRLDKALYIAQGCGGVLREDGTADVMSQCAHGKYYHVNGACNCPDSARAPFNYCKHRISVMLARRATRVASERLANDGAPITPETLTRPAVEVVTPVETATPAAPLYESPASANAFIMVAGHKVLLTVRGHDERDVLARMAKVLAQYPTA